MSAEFDLIVRGGRVLDGGGGPARAVDVGVRGGRVAALDDLSQAVGVVELDAAGAWVTPGFVDVHTHYDLCLGWDGLGEHCLRQGITSVVGGNCGIGAADVAATLDRAAQARLPLHFGVLAPLGPLRCGVVPRAEERAASAEELVRLEGVVSAALDAGALGVSWGPYHANTLAGADELERLLRPAARRGKPFCVHRRSEGLQGEAATLEALELARRSGASLQVSHLKAAGRASWPQLERVLELLGQARREGAVDLAVDVYPYDASLTYLAAMLPEELKAGGVLHRHLASREGRARAHAAAEAWFQERQGPDKILVHEPALPGVPRGATLREATAALGLEDPAEAALRLIEADPGGGGGWATYLEMMDPTQVELLLDLPWAAIASDAVPEESGQGMGASNHPRAYATFARALARAEARGEESLAEAVRRATSFPAERLALPRGRLLEGEVADLVVLRGLRETASHRRPACYPEGIEAVVVAGRVALQGGVLTGAAAGEVLRT